MRLLALSGLLLPGLILPGSPARAQSLASPFASVTQTVDSTTIAVEYYRPSERGRRVFGGLVRWNEVWTPGANWATTLEVDRDVRVEGRPLPRGKYSVWVIPRVAPDSWTVILNRAARRFHVVRPNPGEDELRFQVSPESAPHVEMLTFSFPEVSRAGTTLVFRWAETRLSIRLEVRSSGSPVTPAHAWSGYAGSYELRDTESDSTGPFIRYEVIHRGNGLWVRTTSDAVETGLDPEFDLIPAGGDDFHPRQYKNKQLIGDEPDEVIVFLWEGGVATGFEVRGIAEDRLLSRARRARPPSPGARPQLRPGWPRLR